MEDVLAVYERPYNPKRPLVCVDEVSKTLHDTPRGTLPMEAGQPPRQDYEYERNGTANIFMAERPWLLQPAMVFSFLILPVYPGCQT